MYEINYYIFTRSGDACLPDRQGSPKTEAASDFGLRTPSFFLKFIFCCFLTSLTLSSLAQQSKIDSLRIVIKNDKEDTTKVTHLDQLARLYLKQGSDSLSLETYQQGLHILDKTAIATSQIQTNNIKKLKAGIISSMGTLYKNKGDFFNALSYYTNALKLAEELNDKNMITIFSSHTGIVYKTIGNYPKALEYYLKALKIDEALGNEIGVAKHLGNIGGVYFQLKDYSKALEYVFKSLQIHEKLGNKKSVATSYGNIGNIYAEQKDYTKALEYQFKALKTYQELNNKMGIANVLGNIGAAYFNQGDYQNALANYLSAINKTKDKALLSTQLGGLGSVYAALGRHQEAENNFLKAIALCNTLGLEEQKIQIEQALSDLYSKQGKHKHAYEHYKIYSQLKDSVYTMEKEKDITRKEMNYEFEKKEESTKAENEKQIAVAAARKKKQAIQLGAVVGAMLLLSFILIIIIRSLQIARKQKEIIEKQKEISVNQKITVEEQKHVIDKKQKEILDSIHYAKRIQKAVITSSAYIKQHLHNEYFILFKPKDIVSGDFYWALQHHHKFYVVTADSTGHGVPGAFMSLLNISFLNEAIVERGIIEPHEVLNYVREEIIKALNPEGSERDSRDGMDAILCCYDFENMLLHFAAANNPLWLFRDGEIIEYKPDKMPVGKYSEETKSFTLQTIALQKGDIVYTITDGYADQFGGADNKKLGKKTLRNNLSANSIKSMPDQKTILLKTFNDWKAGQEQIDDVSIMGVKI